MKQADIHFEHRRVHPFQLWSSNRSLVIRPLFWYSIDCFSLFIPPVHSMNMRNSFITVPWCMFIVLNGVLTTLQELADWLVD